MNPVLLSYSDKQGGAARAAYRLHRGLRGVGIRSEMIVNHKISGDASVHGPERSELLKRGKMYLRSELDEIPLWVHRNRKDRPFSVGWVPDNLCQRVDRLDGDLVHLHWAGSGFLRIETVGQFARPVVWTLHDMWPFTGGCHYSQQCKRYKEACGDCPLLNSNRTNDLSRRGWKRRRESLSHADVKFVAPSNWLATRFEESPLAEYASVEVIPNGLDTSFFRPHDMTRSRKLFNFPQDRTVILAGADYTATHKGFHHIENLIEEMTDRAVEWVFFGNVDIGEVENHDSVTHLGWVNDEDLPMLYSSADVTIVPSEQEAFGQTASESLATGTPVVAFNATGLKDIVDHKQTGYLVEPFDTDALRAGIDWIISDGDKLKVLGERARKRAVERYSHDTIAREYFSVYESVLDTSN